jgi:hypothetical protein
MKPTGPTLLPSWLSGLQPGAWEDIRGYVEMGGGYFHDKH